MKAPKSPMSIRRLPVTGPAFCMVLLTSLALLAGPALAQRPGGGGRVQPLMEGSVVSLDDGEMTITTTSGETQSATFDESTVFVREQPITLSDLKVGDHVIVRGPRQEEGPVLARDITVGSAPQETRRPPRGQNGASQLRGPMRPVIGEITETSPLTIETDDGESVEVEITGGTKFAAEITIDRSDLEPGASVRLMIPPRPGETRKAARVILLSANDQPPAAPPATPTNGTSTAHFNVAARAGKVPGYILGTSAGPECGPESIRLLNEAGFRVVSVAAWLAEPSLPGRAAKGSDDSFVSEKLERAEEQVRNLSKAGIEPLVVMTTDSPPDDMDEFVKNVRMCLTRLEAARGAPIAVARFANEPDFHRFWNGTEEEFFEVYRAWATTVHAASPSTILQAPGFMSPTKRDIPDDYHDKLKSFCAKFLAYCDAKKAPLDVFSFHFYGRDLADLRNEIEVTRKALAGHASLSPRFGVPAIAIDEWNITVGTPMGQPIFDTAHTAAHNIAALIEMIRLRVWLSIRWGGIDFDHARSGAQQPGGGNGGGFGAQLRSGDFLMSKADGTLKPVYYACSAFNELQKTPNLLGTVAEKGCTGVAGISDDGTNITVILSFYDADFADAVMKAGKEGLSSKPATVEATVRLDGFPWKAFGGNARLRRYIVDDRRNGEQEGDEVILNEVAIGANAAIRFAASVPSVVMLKLDPAKAAIAKDIAEDPQPVAE